MSRTNHALSVMLVAALAQGCGGAALGPDAGAMLDAGVMAPEDTGTTDAPIAPRHDGGPGPAIGCNTPDGCPPGVWVPVTPSEVDLVNGDCSNFGTKTVQVDPMHPEQLYTLFFCQGVWKSMDYGQTWARLGSGTNSDTVADCAGGVSVGSDDPSVPPTLYVSCIRGAVGFWRSRNGTDWTRLVVPQRSDDVLGQQFYPPAVDPYDPDHLLMTGHGYALLVESTDGGDTWTQVTMTDQMNENGAEGGTGVVAFIDTGDPVTTARTWLWAAAMSTTNGTWRTVDRGVNWDMVDKSTHVNGGMQIFQPDTTGTLFMPGLYSDLGWGVLRSPDYGATWVHVGRGDAVSVVFGTRHNVYAMYGWGIGAGSEVDPALEIAPLPGLDGWMAPGTPAAMTQGPAQAAVTNDGEHDIILVASYNAGLWRYVEP